MSSGSKLIKLGIGHVLEGVGQVVDDSLTKAADAIDNVADSVYDKLSAAATRFLDEIDRAGAQLAEPADDATPKIITKEAMIKAGLDLGSKRLGLNTYDWLESETTQQRLLSDYSIKLRRDEDGGFFAKDLKRLVDEVGFIPKFGEWKRQLLTKLTADV